MAGWNQYFIPTADVTKFWDIDGDSSASTVRIGNQSSVDQFLGFQIPGVLLPAGEYFASAVLSLSGLDTAGPLVRVSAQADANPAVCTTPLEVTAARANKTAAYVDFTWDLTGPLDAIRRSFLNGGFAEILEELRLSHGWVSGNPINLMVETLDADNVNARVEGPRVGQANRCPRLMVTTAAIVSTGDSPATYTRMRSRL